MAGSQQSANLLLAGLPSADFELLQPNLRTVDLRVGFVVINAGEIPARAYFPHSGVIASTIAFRSGHIVSVRITGREGAIGAAMEARHAPSFTSAVVRLHGKASTIDRASLDIALAHSAPLRAAVAKHEAAQQAIADQTVACNAIHDLEARLARLLIRICAMCEHGTFVATQETLAEMLGVRRNAISHVAHAMQSAGIITYSRGNLRVADIHRLQLQSCECHDSFTAFGNDMHRR